MSLTGLAGALQQAALAVGPGPGSGSGWTALVGFSVASTVASQGYRSIATLNTIPWASAAPVKAAGIAAAAVMNLVLFGGRFGIATDKSFFWRIPHSMSLVLQAPWLTALSLVQIGKPGKVGTLIASVGMMSTIPVAMTLIDIGMRKDTAEFKSNKTAFTMLSLTTNVLSVATAYALMYAAFGARNALKAVVVG